MKDFKTLLEEVGDIVATANEGDKQKTALLENFFCCLFEIECYVSKGYRFERDQRIQIALEYGNMSSALFKLKSSSFCTENELSVLTQAETAGKRFLDIVNSLNQQPVHVYPIGGVINTANAYDHYKRKRKQEERLDKIASLVVNAYQQPKAVAPILPPISDQDAMLLLSCPDEYLGI